MTDEPQTAADLHVEEGPTCMDNIGGGMRKRSCPVSVDESTRPSGFVKHDAGKVKMSLVPRLALQGAARVLMFAAKKHGEGNWRKCDEPVDFLDAMMRHIDEVLLGNMIDDGKNGTGLPHVFCIAATSLIVAQLYLDGKFD